MDANVVLGLGLRTPIAAQVKSDMKGGGNKTHAKIRIEILLHLFVLSYTLYGGAIYTPLEAFHWTRMSLQLPRIRGIFPTIVGWFAIQSPCLPQVLSI